jgi:hypothetical protein
VIDKRPRQAARCAMPPEAMRIDVGETRGSGRPAL